MGFMTLCQNLRLISMITSEKERCIILIEKKSLSDLVLTLETDSESNQNLIRQ